MKTKILFLFLIIVYLNSCKKDKEIQTEPTSKSYTFSGKAQKGPFVLGTNVTLNELNSTLGQTGKSFSATITSDDGSFGLSNIEINNSCVLLTATGFYFSEIYGNLSVAPLTLQSISDLTNKSNVNINVFTHVVKGRIENLVSAGKSFQEAKQQAQSELLSFLGVTESFNTDFDNLDISKNNNYNAALLSFSVLLETTNNSGSLFTRTAELTELLTKLNTDLKSDGQINDQKLIDTLSFNASKLNLINIRKNIEKKYVDLGITTQIPDFESYISKFVAKHSKYLYPTFFYPLRASPDPILYPTNTVPNVLVKTDSVFSKSVFCMSAVAPLNKKLTIKFKGVHQNNYYLSAMNQSWEIIDDYPNGFTLNSQRQNTEMTLLLYLEGYYGGTATIEYYENGLAAPTFVKNIKWE